MCDKTKYTCSKCGEAHEQWVALAFDSPTSYNVLSEGMKQEIGELSNDFCVVRHPEQTDRFIRATLTIRVIDYCEDLEYGIWVSLSEKSFQDYTDNFENASHEAKYFGWLSNDFSEYDIPDGGIPTTVFTRTGGLRPEVVPHEDFNHQLVRDYYDGITKAEAESRIGDVLRSIDKRDRASAPSKPWWKLW